MKKIKLNKVFYFSWGGVTLTNDNPTIEADDELIKKMEKFIDNGYLKVVDETEELEGVLEETSENNIGDKDGDLYDFIPDVSEAITVKTERVQTYSKEELEKMNKKELLKIAKDTGLNHAKSITVKELEDLIYNNQ